MSDDITEAPFTLRDGLNVALYDWPLPLRQRPRAVVLIVHGLGEHAWRYDPLAERLNEWGFAVRGYDQRGHGDSGGARGVLPHDDALLEDLLEVVEDTRRHIADPWACPLVLLGHSMGGLVAAEFVRRGLAPVDALALSNGLNPQAISHDPAVVQAYRQDRHVHDRISARLAHFIVQQGPVVVAAAPSWAVPTLLLWAGADRLVRPAGSQAFAAVAPRNVVRSQCLAGQFHEIFNEADPSAAFGALKAWLDEVAPA